MALSWRQVLELITHLALALELALALALELVLE